MPLRTTAAAGHGAAEPATAGSLGQVEQTLICQALEQCAGNLLAAAPVLGVTRSQLVYRARKHGITG
ncbi:helix-turn-helix domain-containing protein (plasmid) [Variovorax sp. 375MFSha3.1]|uniref:helix-turn-helix domain-containing protein n=1 Tax=unclassified Variovorax TaxID=663243 RepID=UPI003AAF40E5